MTEKLPDWYNGNDEIANITLSKECIFSGIKKSSLSMRAPMVPDIRAAQKVGRGSDEDMEAALFASLCECSPSDLQNPDFRYTDYRRLQYAYNRFLVDT